MLHLRNGVRSTSRVGYLVKAGSRDGYFEYAGYGDRVIGIVGEAVRPGELCLIHTAGGSP